MALRKSSLLAWGDGKTGDLADALLVGGDSWTVRDAVCGLVFYF